MPMHLSRARGRRGRSAATPRAVLFVRGRVSSARSRARELRPVDVWGCGAAAPGRDRRQHGQARVAGGVRVGGKGRGGGSNLQVRQMRPKRRRRRTAVRPTRAGLGAARLPCGGAWERGRWCVSREHNRAARQHADVYRGPEIRSNESPQGVEAIVVKNDFTRVERGCGHCVLLPSGLQVGVSGGCRSVDGACKQCWPHVVTWRGPPEPSPAWRRRWRAPRRQP